MDYIFLRLGEEIMYAGMKKLAAILCEISVRVGGVYFKEKKMKIKI